MAAAIARGQRAVHVSSHSFTPELHGEVRTRRRRPALRPGPPWRSGSGAHWKAALARSAPALRVRRNYPYRGRNDGVTSSLRRAHRPGAYVGVEVEVNQAIVLGSPRRWAALRSTLVGTLRAALASF